MKDLKKIMLFLVVLFITFGLTTSCSSDDDSGDDNPSGEFLKAKVDGTNWSSSTSYDLVSASKATNLLSVQASNDSGDAIRFSMHSYTGTGTYTTGDAVTSPNSISYVTVTPIASWTSGFDIGTGTIEITSDTNGVVEGTFSFEGYNASDQTTKIITNGEFKANVD